MKKTISKLVLLLAMIGMPYPSPADDALKPIDITLGEWKPYVSRGLEGYGELTRKITLTLERMGYRPNYQFMPWGQAEKLVRTNPGNNGPRGTFPFLKVGDRPEKFYFSRKPILTKCIVFFYNKDKVSHKPGAKAVLTSLHDLLQYKLGYIKQSAGYQYPAVLQKILRQKGTAVDSDYILFKKLIDEDAEDIQVVPEVKEVGKELLLDSFPGQQAKIAMFEEDAGKQRCLLKENYYFIASKLNPDNAEFIDKFNLQYQALLDLGTIEQLAGSAKIQPALGRPEVILSTDSAEGVIKARDGDKEYLLPRGTRALLLNWRPDVGKGAVTARIYILTYPYRGQELNVDGRYIELQ